MSDLTAKIQAAAASGQLLESSAKNVLALLAKTSSPIDEASIRELVEAGNWKELDNRFFRTLAFGTGGLRGKTISPAVTRAEQGSPQPLGRPEFPCVGTNAMNYYNISRATQGLVAHVKEYFTKAGRSGKPSICICHDTRFFSREFAELAAKVITENGCNAYLFEGPRSTPELSFSVRYTKSQAGINITASHNPPEYNGYKVYFEDGGQVVEPNASGIIAKVNAVESDVYTPVPAPEQGKVIAMGADIDEAYMKRLETLPLDPELIRAQNSFKVVVSAASRRGRHNHQADARPTRLPLPDRGGTGRPRRSIPHRQIPEPGERRSAQHGHEARRRNRRGPCRSHGPRLRPDGHCRPGRHRQNDPPYREPNRLAHGMVSRHEAF